MFAEQAVVLATGTVAGSHFNAAVARLAFGTDDIGRFHARGITSLGSKFQLSREIPPLDAKYRCSILQVAGSMVKLSDNRVGDRLHAADGAFLAKGMSKTAYLPSLFLILPRRL
jgi:hypothetical protein